MFGYSLKWLDEKKVIEILTTFKIPGVLRPDLEPFRNLIHDPLKAIVLEEYDGLYIGTNILREEFKLERTGRPGDFDIIIIPYNSERLFYDRTAIFEVKIIRPHINKINKNAKSLGENQIYGLLDDGFPLVGLLHVVMSIPLEEDEAHYIKKFKYPIPYYKGSPITEDDYEWVPFDWLPHHAINNQFNRIISAGFPKHVGINVIGLNCKEERYSLSYNYEYKGFTSGYFNPKKSLKTIECIKTHFNTYGLTRYKKIILNSILN